MTLEIITFEHEGHHVDVVLASDDMRLSDAELTEKILLPAIRALRKRVAEGPAAA